MQDTNIPSKYFIQFIILPDDGPTKLKTCRR